MGGMDDLDFTDEAIARRAADDRRRERTETMRKRLAKTPLSTFTADYTLDICIVSDSSILGSRADMGFARDRALDEALQRLESFFYMRDNPRRRRRI